MPIEINVEQRSKVWFDLRKGVLTTSNFKDIITPTGKLSSKRHGLLGKLLADYFNFDLGPEVNAYWMQRGIELEPEAREAYASMEGVDVTQTGFVFKDETRTVGGSPDGLIGDDGIVEIKCPAPFTHLTWLYEALKNEVVPDDHKPQLQGLLWVCERKWIDFFSYLPDAPRLLLRVEADPKFQDAFDQHVPLFLKELSEAKEFLRAEFNKFLRAEFNKTKEV